MDNTNTKNEMGKKYTHIKTQIVITIWLLLLLAVAVFVTAEVADGLDCW